VSVRLAFECPAGGTHPPLETVDAEAPAELPSAIPCASGGPPHLLHREHVAPAGGLLGCLACGHPELYTQKDFPRMAGLAIVVVAAILAPFTWYLSLVAAAALDLVLYVFGPEVVTCYVCSANHHRFPREPRHPRFDREIDERLRYGARAVMGKPMRAGGTAGAPEPEH
jgi:hypothetical protein